MQGSIPRERRIMNHRELKRRRRRARVWKKEHDFYLGIDRRLSKNKIRSLGTFMGMDLGFGDQTAIFVALRVPVKYIKLTFTLKEEIDGAAEMHS
jgi:hypothetical protein